MGRLESLARGTPTGTVLRTVALANPDPGAGFSLTPDAGRAWEVLSVLCSIATSAVDGDRAPGLTLLVGDQPVWTLTGAGSVGPSSAGSALWIADWSFTAISDGAFPAVASMPHVILQPGYALRVDIIALDPDDQVSNIVAQVLEVSTGTREAERDAAERFAERLGAFLDLSREDY